MGEFSPAEKWVAAAVEWLRLGVEIVGVLIVAFGVLAAVFYLARLFFHRKSSDFHQVRLILAKYLALALEFQLASDILSTAVAPTWEQIGKLGAIAVIRTGLNFFLMREMKMETSSTTVGVGRFKET